MSDRVDFPPSRVAAAERPSLSSLLRLGISVVIIAGLYFGREVLVPITLAMLLSFLLVPLVNLLRRARLPKAVAVLLATALALGVILLLGALIGSQLASLAGDLPHYEQTIEGKVASARSYVSGRIDWLMNGIGHELQLGAEAPGGQAGAPAAAKPGNDAPTQQGQPDLSPFKLLSFVVMPTLGPLATAGLILIMTVFILMQQEDVRDRLIRLFGSNDLHRTTMALDDAGHRLSRYFLVQLGLNAGFGVVIGAGLLFIGVPSPALWGILGMLMRFVPYIGAPIAALLPVLLAAAVDPGWSMVVWTIALFAVAELLMGQVIEPLVYGRSTGMTPLSVVLAAIFWTWLWGPVGLVLSTPITLCLVVLGRHFEPLQFLDVLFGDRPPLTPVERLYQRMLAGDGMEAVDQAEALLRTCPLEEYYDAVALGALQLAGGDLHRGAMTPERLDRVKETVQELVEELDETDESKTAASVAREPAERGAGIGADTIAPRTGMLCVAGNGPLDEFCAAMLAQLLHRRGVAADVVTYAQLPRRAAPDAASGVGAGGNGYAAVCVVVLEVPGAPARLRAVMRHVRARYPGLPVLVAACPAAGPDESGATPRVRPAVSADGYAASLREAVRLGVGLTTRLPQAPPMVAPAAE